MSKVFSNLDSRIDGVAMGQILHYMHPSEWITERSIWRPPDTITLRDEAGVAISSATMTTMVMTIYDLSGSDHDIVNAVEQVDVKNVRSCSISSQGIFVPVLLPGDTIILDDAHVYEMRAVLIEYTWASGTKADALKLVVIIRNLERRPYITP
jgi:hypothetical protein